MTPARALKAPALAIALALTACGGGSGDAASPALPGIVTGNPGGNLNGTTTSGNNGGTSPSSQPPAPAPDPAALGIAACAPAGGHDYQVGPGAGQLAHIQDVPWESLQPGDTVRIFWQAAAYRGKFMLSTSGTAAAPIRVCGVPGPNGERPIVDGANAVSRTQLAYSNDNNGPGLLHQTRSVIVIKPSANDDYRYFPQYLQVDGLVIQGATPTNTFTDTLGRTQAYDPFGGCVWIERGHHIQLLNNEIRDCTNGIFSKSTDDSFDEGNPTGFSQTQDLRIAYNDIHDNGVVGDDHEHNSYVQTVGVVYEFNHYGPLRAGAGGSALKDRSVGAVIRYNRIEGGARSLDLVEAEDYPNTATHDAAYHQTFVYGNQIVKEGATGIAVHYGGDHTGAPAGAVWGETIFRKGTLWFFHNTVVITGADYAPYIFQLSTQDETAEVFNNVFVFRDNPQEPSLRGGQDVGTGYTNGGVINLGRNWINQGWQLNDQYHPLPGAVVNGAGNMVTAGPVPVDLATFIPVAGAAAIDAALAGPQATPGFQLAPGLLPAARATSGAAADLGAVER